MPWPISAGVFGIARTTRSLPVARAMASLRMPAITLSCRRLADVRGARRAASAKSCGLTAQTTTSPRRPATASAAAARLTPKRARSALALASAGLDDEDRAAGAARCEQPADDARWPCCRRR